MACVRCDIRRLGDQEGPRGGRALRVVRDREIRVGVFVVRTAPRERREDDAVLEQWLRENLNTTWHSLGTCKMAPREDFGVVDASLGVHGIANLKIADLSIAPENVGANTNNTALMIGEKAADIFIRELGLGV